MENLCKCYIVNPWPFTSVVNIGSAQPRLGRDHSSWVKCATSTMFLESGISAVLMVMSSLWSFFD
jgi:hypothetical protein